MSSPITGTAPDDPNSGEFGANEWLVDELYERYLVDKNSVDKSWWPVLESYHPVTDPTPTTNSSDKTHQPRNTLAGSAHMFPPVLLGPARTSYLCAGAQFSL